MAQQLREPFWLADAQFSVSQTGEQFHAAPGDQPMEELCGPADASGLPAARDDLYPGGRFGQVCFLFSYMICYAQRHRAFLQRRLTLADRPRTATDEPAMRMI